jgi:hypothetical protein
MSLVEGEVFDDAETSRFITFCSWKIRKSAPWPTELTCRLVAVANTTGQKSPESVIALPVFRLPGRLCLLTGRDDLGRDSLTNGHAFLLLLFIYGSF